MKKESTAEFTMNLNSLEISESAMQAIETEFKKYTGNKMRTYVALIMGIMFLLSSFAGNLTLANPTEKQEGGFVILFFMGIALILDARSNAHRIKMRNAVTELINKSEPEHGAYRNNAR